ncbi:MAG: hypothetical protein WAT92_06440 [Saprospiraceae bacterium]
MKKINLAFLMLILLIQSVGCQVYKSNIRNDNDFSSYDDSKYCENIATPKVISNEFSRILSEIKTINGRAGNYYSHLIKIDSSIDIYVFSVRSISTFDHYIFAYNSIDNHKISKKPVVINGKWSENNEDGFDLKLMNLPNFRLIDKKENVLNIIIKERVHNGNVYDALFEKYFELNQKTLEFTLKYCIESKACGIDDIIIERLIEGNEVKVYKRDKNKVEEIGSYVLSDDMKKIISKKCIDDYFCNQLVTLSGLDDQSVLSNGYLFRY